MPSSISSRINEHFRIPEGMLSISACESLPERPEYFRLGDGLTLFGHCWKSAAVAGTGLHNALPDVRCEDSSCTLPFDPDEIASNLLCERYLLSRSKSRWMEEIFRPFYYLLRPFLPVALRKHLQRRALRGRERRQFPSWPVDRTVDRLHEELLKLALKASGATEIPFIWFWPEGHRACVLMTHDVETQSGLDACSALMNLDDSYGIPSSFQLIPRSRYQVTDAVLTRFRQRGFEINVHDWNHDGSLFRSHDTFIDRAQKINQCANEWKTGGFRSGALYRNSEWIRALSVSYDMSVPNAAHLEPQSGGCCTLFPWFNGRILEIPVTMTQDYALFHFLNRYSIDLWKLQLQTAFENNGTACFIVHPDYIQDSRAHRVYEDLLGYLRSLNTQHDLWMTQPAEVDCWWRQRSQMSLTKESGLWEVSGPGSERARVAFARLEGDKLVYTIDAPRSNASSVAGSSASLN